MTEHARLRRGLTEFLIIVPGVGTALTVLAKKQHDGRRATFGANREKFEARHKSH